jgi:integrase
MLQDSRSLWRGIDRHGAGWRAVVRITGHPRSTQPFPFDTDPAVMQAWRTREKRRLRELPEHTATGGFADDARHKYLPARAAMPGIKERTRHIEIWIAEFGNRPRSTIQGWEIAQVRDRWLTVGPKRVCRRYADDNIPKPGARWIEIPEPLSVSQVQKRMRALENLWTVLDGRHAPNPVREAGEPPDEDLEARGLPYDVVEAILAQLPDRGRPTGAGKGTRPKVSLTKLRLAVIGYAGLSHGEIMSLDENRGDLHHLHDAVPSVWVEGRRKGKGTTGIQQPLTAEGAAAIRALVAAKGLGTFSPRSMWKTFQRACTKLGLQGIRPYDLRHSYASEIFEKTGNLSTTQLLMRQKDARTTLRYGRRALSPVLVAAIAQVRAAGGFGTFAAPANAPAPVTDSNDETKT